MTNDYKPRLVLVLLLFCFVGSAQTVGVTQEQIKAAYLAKFAQNISFPSNSLTGFKSPLVIGIIGDDPFGPLLDKTLQAQVRSDDSDAQRPMVARRCKNITDIYGVHVLYFSATNDDDTLIAQLAAIKGKPILLVGESPSFLDCGGMVRLKLTNSYIVYDVKLDSALAANLRIAPKLLKYANRVFSPRAAALKTFTRYVEFPTGTFPTTNSPIVIGVLGTDSFCEVLDQTLPSAYDTPPLEVRYFDRPENVSGVHVLYLGESRNSSMEQDLAYFQAKPVLLVSEYQNLLKLGGMVRLYPTNYPTAKHNQTIEALAWDVNLDRMQESNLDIRYKMWHLATRVFSSDPKKAR